MLRQLFKDSMLYGAAGIMARGIPLIMIPFFTRVLSPSDYGVVDILIIVAALANLTVAAEISQGLARYFADAETSDDKAGYASSALWFTCAAYFTFLVISNVFAPALNRFLFDSTQWTWVWRLAVAAMVGNGIYYLVLDLLRWQLNPRGYGISSLVYTTVSVVVSAYLILYLRSGIQGIFLGQIAGAMVGGTCAWGFSKGIFYFQFDRQKWREMVTFSLPLVPSSIAVFFSLYIDRISIRYFMSLSDVGVYGIGFRVASIMLLLVLGVQASLTPLIYRHYKESETRAEIARSFRYFLLMAFGLYIFISAHAREIISLVTPTSYHEAWRVIPILCLSILIGNLYIFAPGLAIAKKTGIIAGLNLAAAAVNALLNVILIPLWGIVGAAAATFLSSLLCFACHMFFSQRLYRVPHQWIRLLTAFIVAISTVTVALTLGTYGLPINDIIVKLTIVAISGVFISLVMLRKNEWGYLFHRAGIRNA